MYIRDVHKYSTYGIRIHTYLTYISSVKGYSLHSGIYSTCGIRIRTYLTYICAAKGYSSLAICNLRVDIVNNIRYRVLIYTQST